MRTTKKVRASLNNRGSVEGACFCVVSGVTRTKIAKGKPVMEKLNMELSTGENSRDSASVCRPINHLESLERPLVAIA